MLEVVKMVNGVPPPHVRRELVLLVEHLRARKAYVVAFEGHLTDFINGLNAEPPPLNRQGRTEAVVASFADAVPPDIRDVPYRPLNLAPQLK
jgi:hypothetical protein